MNAFMLIYELLREIQKLQQEVQTLKKQIQEKKWYITLFSGSTVT